MSDQSKISDTAVGFFIAVPAALLVVLGLLLVVGGLIKDSVPFAATGCFIIVVGVVQIAACVTAEPLDDPDDDEDE